MISMGSNKTSEFVDVRTLFRDYFIDRWYYYVISVFLCVIVGLLFSRIYTQKNKVQANVMIQRDQSGSMPTTSGTAILSGIFGVNGDVQDEIFIISSHSLYRDVVKKLNLNKMCYVKDGFLKKHLAYPDYPIDVQSTGIADTLRNNVVFKIQVEANGLANIEAKALGDKIGSANNVKLPVIMDTSYGHFTIMPTEFFKKNENFVATIVFLGYEKAAELLNEEINAEIASKQSNVITLSMNTPNVDYGRDILDCVIAEYNMRGINDKNLQSRKTAEFLEERINIIAGDLDGIEGVIQDYKQNNNIVDVDVEATYQIEKKSKFEAALLEAETEMEVLNMTCEFLSDSASSYAMIPTVTQNSGLQSGIDAYNALVLKRNGLLNNAKSNNFALKQINRQLDQARGNIISSCRKIYDASRVKVNELRDERSRINAKLGGVPKQEYEYLKIKRQQSIKQELYLFLLQRQEETEMILANATPKGVVVDKAFVLSTPIGISKKGILIVALFFGLCLPPIYFYILNILRNKVSTKGELESITNVPVIGEICVNNSREELIVKPNGDSSISELFRLLRSNLLFVLNGTDNKVVTVTSTSSGDGKSFVSINLAASLSLLGKRVLLIGMDIRKPRLESALNIKAKFGLTQYLSVKDMSVDNIINHISVLENLDVITAGPVPPNPSELLSSKRLDDLMLMLRDKYDYIVIDSAPVGMVSDTYSLNRFSDTNLYVVRANVTHRNDLRLAEDIYEQNRLSKLYLIINGTKNGHGHGYGYGSKQV